MGFTPSFQGSIIMVSRIIILSAAIFLVAQAFSIDPFKIDKRWERYKKAYNKTYPSDSEEARRHAIWKNNTMLIVEHNKLFHANKTTFRLGMNVHGDMTATEFAARFNGFHKKHPNSHGPWNPSSQVDVRDLPAEVNWEKKGYVTPIKNQQQCGSCWAFSATGSMEGAHFKATDTEASYPYTAMDGTCKFNASNVGATIKSWTDVASGSEPDLQKAVATVGPVSVAIDASQYTFQLYSSGIYHDDNCSSQFLDHGVLAVGYGSAKTGTIKDYWLVKNSWGTDWGMKGYIKMSRNNNNNCGIATSASYPVV